MESPITFGEWLRQSRNGLKLTRVEFARRIGCSVSTLRKIEDSERRPSSQIAELMANCLNIPPAQRSTFVKVARGELSVDHLSLPSMPLTSLGISSTSTTPPTNLPVLPTPMIGRQGEVEQLSQLLSDPQCRLLTLVGPGGVGKTRLAIETASNMQAAFADGVYFVSLASINSTRFIVPLIADAIGFAFQGANPVDPKKQLFSYLKEKKALLLTDNLEHLLTEPGIELLTELLANTSHVKLLATTREPLRVQDEWVFEVQGLPIPESEKAKESAQNTSVELFLQRAKRAYVGFNVKAKDYPAIIRICQLVDGMPLGIELAAAWVRTLSCDEIAQEIEKGLDFLSVSGRDLPSRHRSMRAVFDHSWKLLTEEEQEVLLQLSVFQGGFRHEAAEDVAYATLSSLYNLVTKSLVRRNSAGRYDLHELIRQFSSERFAEHPKEKKATYERHGKYYLSLFSQADIRLRSSTQREALAELTVEMDNFRIAWDWAVDHGKFTLIEQTSRTYETFFDTRGWLQEGLDTLGRAVSAIESFQRQSPPDRTNQIALGHLLAARSLFAFRMAQHELAKEMLERSIEILRPLNEPRVLVESITFLGIVMVLTGNYSKALQLLGEGLEISLSIGDKWFAALCLNQRASTILRISGPEKAYEQLQSAVANWRDLGDPRFTSFALNILSQSALTLGRYDEASAALEESVALSTSVGDRWGLGTAYRGLGILAQAQNKHQQAIGMFHKSLEILTELGARQDVAQGLAQMSRSVFAMGNDAEAGNLLRESLVIATETRGIFIALDALVGMAGLEMKRGDPVHALALLVVILNHPATVQETRARATHLRAELEAQMTRRKVDAAHEWVKDKTFESIVEEVLNQTS